MMPGAGRLGGRGPAVTTARIPTAPIAALDPANASMLPFRLASLAAAQLFDFGTFTVMIGRHGIAAEANPLIAQGFAAFGIPLLAMTKLALIVLLASIVVILARDRPGRWPLPGLAALVTVLAVVGGLVGGISNLFAG